MWKIILIAFAVFFTNLFSVRGDGTTSQMLLTVKIYIFYYITVTNVKIISKYYRLLSLDMHFLSFWKDVDLKINQFMQTFFEWLAIFEITWDLSTFLDQTFSFSPLMHFILKLVNRKDKWLPYYNLIMNLYIVLCCNFTSESELLFKIDLTLLKNPWRKGWTEWLSIIHLRTQ